MGRRHKIKKINIRKYETVAILVYKFVVKYYINTIAYVSVFYLHKSFQEPKLNGASVTPHSRIRASAILLKSFIRNGKLWFWVLLEWYEFRMILRDNK